MRADDPGSNAPFRKLQRKEECSKVPAGAFIFNLFSISLLTLAKLHLPMFHVNEYAQKVGGINGLMFSFLPEFYAATSIRDFLDNKDEMKLTDSLLPPAVLLRKGALIKFPWLNFEYLHSSSMRVKVSDLQGELDVDFLNGRLFLDNGFEIPYTEKKRICQPVLMYRQKKYHKELRLLDFKLHGPEAPGTLENRVLSYGLGPFI